MKLEAKQKWIEALRSGKYRQTRRTLLGHVLDKEDKPILEYGEVVKGQCCLGVLLSCHGIDIDEDVGVGGYIDNAFAINTFALQSETQRKLAKLNDLEEQNFSQIADWIEQNL